MVLCRMSASESLAEVANMDGCALGVLSMVVITWEISVDAEWG